MEAEGFEDSEDSLCAVDAESNSWRLLDFITFLHPKTLILFVYDSNEPISDLHLLHCLLMWKLMSFGN